MRFQRADWIFLLAAAFVVLLVAQLPSPRDRNPPVPDTVDHRAVTSEHDCLRCHAAGERRALSSRHPARQDCFRCHREPQAVGMNLGEDAWSHQSIRIGSG